MVVPVLDGAGQIGTCVSRLRGQTRPPDELIVVDNGSSDATAAVAAGAGAKVVGQPVRGVYRARNTGWRGSDADVIAFTDADCEPEPDWLEKLVEPFSDPTVAGVGGEAPLAEVRTAAQRWVVLRGFMSQERNYAHGFLPFFATANAAYRRSALETVGGFEERFWSGGDTDLSWRVQAFGAGRLVLRPEARVIHRFAEDWTEVTSRSRRYAGGHALLDVRWSAWPAYRATRGTFLQRTRGVWLLPGRLPYRLVRGTDVSIPLIDAAVRASYEIGLAEGRRRARLLDLEPLPAPAPAAGIR